MQDLCYASAQHYTDAVWDPHAGADSTVALHYVHADTALIPLCRWAALVPLQYNTNTQGDLDHPHTVRALSCDNAATSRLRLRHLCCTRLQRPLGRQCMSTVLLPLDRLLSTLIPLGCMTDITM